MPLISQHCGDKCNDSGQEPIQGRNRSRAGSGAAVDRRTVIRGREGTEQAWKESQALSPGCPMVGREEQSSSDWGRVCRLVLPASSSSLLRRPLWTVKEEPRDENTLPAMGHCDLGPVGEAVLGGSRVPAPPSVIADGVAFS